MSTAIKAQANLNYGGAQALQKYNPLYNIRLSEDDEDKELCSKIFTNRSGLLANLGVLPGTLLLGAMNWQQIIDSEKERIKPPLVVVSSNRSNWIKAGIEAGDAKLKVLKFKPPNFNGVTDLRALQMEGIHPPIYSPKRIERPGKLLDRNVYIVVAASEFSKYRANLKDTGITVIGWKFQGEQSLNGFGASRFAAIQFCKTLRANARNHWNYSWLFDDNVVAIEPFMGLDEAEKSIKNGNYACFGFHGANVANSNSDNYDWALKRKHSSNNYNENKGLLQQAVLWNIKYLTDEGLNFPPIFLASAEDVSLSRYFDRKEIPYCFFKNNFIRKEITTYDGHSGLLPLTDYFAKLESNTTLNDPPPPVNIQDNGNKYTVGTFVDDWVLPNSTEKDTKTQATNAQFRNKAACQAVEQIMKLAVIRKTWADDAALTSTFVNVMKKQDVILRILGS
jgi:hypothetical protein